MNYLSNKNVTLFNLICIEFSHKIKGRFEKLLTLCLSISKKVDCIMNHAKMK